ncbi:hypothetical protein L3Q82_010423 [Scortum barcoo]|uniref:Uncharacterized protein n=1 Tax=Scortum barcoo TaxID=214431 RepID=A0ACB8WBS3_9TELE|nr:hypothetical protein L3Q82_010423 [Scortum barcoo]
MWKEYFEDLLNPTDTHSPEETEPGGSGLYQGTGEESSTDSSIEQNNVVFVLVVEQWTSSFTLGRVLEGAWEFAQPVYMCFVDLDYDCVPRGTLWGALQEYGVDSITVL